MSRHVGPSKSDLGSDSKTLSLLASLLGLFNAFRMMRLPDVEPAAEAEAAALL